MPRDYLARRMDPGANILVVLKGGPADGQCEWVRPTDLRLAVPVLDIKGHLLYGGQLAHGLYYYTPTGTHDDAGHPIWA